MKVVHIVTRFRRGGSEINLQHFLKWQRRHGHDVSLVVGGDSDTAALPSWVNARVIPSLVRQMSPASDLNALRILRSYLAYERADVIHTHQSKAGILGRVSAWGLRAVRVHTVHMASFGPGYGWQSQPFALAERACARGTDILVTVGEELRDAFLREGIGRPSQYALVRSPAHVERFIATRSWPIAHRLAVRARWELPDDKAIILSLGALERRKRHALVISALRPLLLANRALLLIVGEGPERAPLERLMRDWSLGHAIRLTGFVEATEELYAVANVLVQASTAEGVPQVVLQALAAGLPVVATDAEGLREVPASGVRIVGRSGAGLLPAVEQSLARPVSPIDPALLHPWSLPAVELQVAELHDRIERRLRQRDGTTAHSSVPRVAWLREAVMTRSRSSTGSSSSPWGTGPR
jgi:glycosyltransferase involved in cell wall biosynthesis